MPRFPTTYLNALKSKNLTTNITHKPILRLSVDGSILSYPKHITVNSEFLVSAMRELGLKVKDHELVPGKGLTIVIKNVC